mmetsp:Transcript_11401/g.13900  ORF Transcript_11401/g.13900 Transcript_11401/m.13900 type:complete len:405 (-) Transcript_11401:570-1784(-)
MRINFLHEFQTPQNLTLNLILPAINMRIILLKPPDPCQPRERSTQFVPVQHPKISEPHGQIPITPDRIGKHEAMTGTIHRFEGKFLILHGEAEHGILVMQGVTGLVPQVEVVDVGGDDFVIPPFPVMITDVIHEFLVDSSSVGQPEGRSRGEFVEHDQLLRVSDATMIAFLGFFLVFFPNFEHFLVGEGDSVHALQGIVGSLSEPAGGAVAGAGEGLHLAGVLHVRTAAEINEVAAAVHRGAFTVTHLGVEDGKFEGVGRKQFQSFLLGQHQPFEFLLLFGDFGHFRLDHFVILLLEIEIAFAHVAIVVESSTERRTDGELAPEGMLERFSEHVRTAVPKHRFRVGIVEFQKLELAHATHQNSIHIPQIRSQLGRFFRFHSPILHFLGHYIHPGHAILHRIVIR